MSLSGGVHGQFMSVGPKDTVVLRLVPDLSLPSGSPESSRRVADRPQDTQTVVQWGELGARTKLSFLSFSSE